MFEGTTLLLAVVERNFIVVANVGDSRGILRYSNGTTINVSVDHKPNLVGSLDAALICLHEECDLWFVILP